VEAVRSKAALYAHALAMEQAAAARYRELAQLAADRGDAPVAALFAHLAAREEQHLRSAALRAQSLDLPLLKSWQYRWVDTGPPESVAPELGARLATTHDALKVALEAEQRARAFYEQVFAAATDPDVKLLAAALAQEEDQHAELLERALATTDAHIDWERFFAPGG
jgi:rubrerythrin